MARNKKAELEPRKKPAQARSQKMVTDILSAARTLLKTHGYQKFNTNKIAEMTGISVGSLYQYFPSKESIASCLIERYFADILLRDRLRTPQFLSLPFEEALKQITRHILDHRDDIRLYRTIIEESPQCIDKDFIKRFQGEFIASLFARFTQRDSEIKVENRYLAAFIVFHLYEGTLRSLDRFKDEVAMEEIMAEINKMILNYLTKE